MWNLVLAGNLGFFLGVGIKNPLEPMGFMLQLVSRTFIFTSREWYYKKKNRQEIYFLAAKNLGLT
jgi:hypothetical protein